MSSAQSRYALCHRPRVLLTPLQLDSKGILQVRPDFNSERLPYRIETTQHDIFEYVLEHCSRPMDEEVRKKEAQIKKGAIRCVSFCAI